MLLPHNPNAFARSPLDRAAHLRRDSAWLAEALKSQQAQIIAFHHHRPYLREAGEGLAVHWLAGDVHAAFGRQDRPPLFLGLDDAKAPVFACDIADPAALGDAGEFVELRTALPRLEADKLGLIGCARSIFEWHEKNTFCANCGVRTEIVEAGWRRDCPACKREHYPRFDPVVIMVPIFGEKCLLGRQKAWAPGMFSALAGFVEPGESIEEAVARETLEEAGLVVREVRFHSTQPWPFPHSLMFGALCDVTHDQDRVDEHELESTRWFSREEARALTAAAHPECKSPPAFAIAHQLIKTWSEGG